MVSKMQAYIKEAPPSKCLQCGVQMERKRYASGRLEDLGMFTRRKFCSVACQNASLVKESVTKGSHRHRARRLKRSCCEQCSSVRNLQVHHKDKDVTNNAPMNLQTLCASCHNTLHWKERKAHGVSS